LFLDCEQIFLY